MEKSRFVRVVTNGPIPSGSAIAMSPATPSPNIERARLAKSLTDAWDEARQKLFGETSSFASKRKNKVAIFTDIPADLDTFLDRWGATYERDESATSRKKNRVLSIIQNVIDGFQTVGSIAAEGASIAFPPAGVCFSALSFLLDIPSRIKHVFDNIMDLFEEVEAFFVRFKVLKLLDDRGRLDLVMVEGTNKLLISFVEICCLSFDLLENNKLKTSLKAALLNNDSGTGDALASFRNQAHRLDSLTNTVALDHIIATQETGENTNFVAKDTQGMVRSLVDDKTKMMNQARVTRIEEKIYARGERDSAVLSTKVQQASNELLKGTLSHLEENERYTEWKDSASSSERAVLLLMGESGTGKSCALEALKDSLDSERLNPREGAQNIYVAVHVFDNRRSRTTEDSEQNPLATALRSMAVQVAWTSLRYAKDLEKQIQRQEEQKKPIKDMKDIVELWDILKLSTFDAPPDATMYLLFDGIEQGDDLHSISKLFFEDHPQGKHSKDTLKVRAIVAVDSSKPESGAIFGIPRIRLDTVTRKLVCNYAEKRMKQLEIFQHPDKKSRARKDKVMQSFREGRRTSGGEIRYWTFKDIDNKLDRIGDAIQSGSSSKMLENILRDESDQSTNLEAQKTLDAILATLTSKQISQLHQIIPWIVHCVGYMGLEELEAVLFLASDCDSLQSLSQMMNTSFGDLFTRYRDLVELKDEFADIIAQNDAISFLGSSERGPLISMNITINDAEESVVRQFVWQLNEQMSSGRFDFSSYSSINTNSVYTNKIQGNLVIAKMCLKLLNEGWVTETEVLVPYARNYCLGHVSELYNDISKLSRSDQQMVSRGLVNFLSDPYHLARDPDRHFGRLSSWLGGTGCAQNIKSWLMETSKVLEPREKRWVAKVLDPAEGNVGFLKDIALSVGHKWIAHNKINALEHDKEEEIRTSNELEVYLFEWLYKFIEMVSISATRALVGTNANSLILRTRRNNIKILLIQKLMIRMETALKRPRNRMTGRLTIMIKMNLQHLPEMKKIFRQVK